MNNQKMSEMLTDATRKHTPILRQFTQKINENGGYNLGQGMCLLPPPKIAINEYCRALKEINNANAYCSAAGVQELIDATKDQLHKFNKIDIKKSEVIITAGATGAFDTVCNALFDNTQNEKVIILCPYYPYHVNKLLDCKVNMKFIHFKQPDWGLDLIELETAFNSFKPKAIVFCNPGNPTGKVFNLTELNKISELCAKHGTICIVDETYQHIIYEGRNHISIASIEDMATRTVTIGSFSKTFCITGWRVGYLCCPVEFFNGFRFLYDQNFLCTNTPAQYAILSALNLLTKEYYVKMITTLTKNRDYVCSSLKKIGFEVSIPNGAYYTIVHTKGLFPGKTATDIAYDLFENSRVASVPSIDFLRFTDSANAIENQFLRFSFALPNEVLKGAMKTLLTHFSSK